MLCTFSMKTAQYLQKYEGGPYQVNNELFKVSNKNTRKRFYLKQSQQSKHLKKMRNMFRVNNNATRATSVASFWCLHC